ncbi:hypothetical protein [Sphingomonas azotifigens]|uniref:hypothetical protein n=1 Tax=Sphingomonas azotifigens TaxID=330920 RepID=UPI000A019EAE|nr:hypothetical protein [Sphingomonas azotifigens]
MAAGHCGGSQAPIPNDTADQLRDAKLVIRGVWADGTERPVILHEQYQRPAKWWHKAARLAGILMVALAIGWPVILLAYGWTRTGLFFVVVDAALLWTGREVMTLSEKKWL